MTKLFTANGKNYKTNEDTYNVLVSVSAGAIENKDASALIAIIAIGTLTGQIIEVK